MFCRFTFDVFNDMDTRMPPVSAAVYLRNLQLHLLPGSESDTDECLGFSYSLVTFQKKHQTLSSSLPNAPPFHSGDIFLKTLHAQLGSISTKLLFFRSFLFVFLFNGDFFSSRKKTAQKNIERCLQNCATRSTT